MAFGVAFSSSSSGAGYADGGWGTRGTVPGSPNLLSFSGEGPQPCSVTLHRWTMRVTVRAS